MLKAITPVLMELFNLSITSGSIPQTEWKLSSVKSQTYADNPLNYRPICLFSVVSKVIEGHIYKNKKI